MSQSTASSAPDPVAIYGDQGPANLSRAIEVAGNIAVQAHDGQVDKQGLAYIDHPFRVAARALDLAQQDPFHSSYGDGSLVYIVALLHDVVEDSDLELGDVREELSFYLNQHQLDVVTLALGAITKKGGESYDDYLQRVRSDPVARTVKRADVEDNFGRLGDLSPAERPRLAGKYVHARTVLAW